MTFADGATTDATTLSSLTVTNSVIGLEKGTTASVTHLTMNGGSFSRRLYRYRLCQEHRSRRAGRRHRR